MEIEPPDLYCRKQYKKFCKDYRNFEDRYRLAFKAVVAYFNSEIINLGNLHKLTDMVCSDVKVSLWKTSIAIEGLRAGQFPRIWFGFIPGFGIIVPLCLDAHKSNYSDNQLEAQARTLLCKYVDSACPRFE